VESDLLLACAEWAVDADAAGEVVEAASRVSNWVRFLEMADEHSLMPIAADCLTSCGVTMPVETLSALKAAWGDNAKRAMVLAGELERLLARFGAAGIRAITLKGPALGRALYRDPAHRFSGDLDLLVRPEDLVRAEALLESEGYREPGDERLRRARRAFRRSTYEALFLNPVSGIAVDLHWDLLPPGFPVRFRMPEVWARSEGSRLAAADELAFLCAHADKHESPSLGRAVDIRLLLKSRPDLTMPERPGRLARLGYTARLAVTPTEADWESLRLPVFLYYLYYPWRMLRLGRKHLLSSGRTG
jgi:hypothetical protein